MDELFDLERKLSKSLLRQSFSLSAADESILAYYKELAQSYMAIENNIVVLSDYLTNQSYLYVGGFGQNFGFSLGETKIASAFEKELFEKVHPEDLLERHALELSYIQLQKEIDPKQRSMYISYCNVRLKNSNKDYVVVNHRMQYVRSFDNGRFWLSLCIYSPSTDFIPGNGINGRILNSNTGEVKAIRNVRSTQKSILTKREVQILKHLGKGCTSKEISSELNLSTNTIYRHRQNIIEKLDVHNSSEAIQVGIILGLMK